MWGGMSKEREASKSAGRVDLAVGAVALLLGGAAFGLIPSEVSRDAFRSFGNVRSPAFFPVLASGLLILFSAALVLRSWKDRADRPASLSTFPPSVAVVVCIFVAAGISITLVGFAPSACALIVGLSYAFGARSHVAVVALAVAVPTAIQLLFKSVLGVLLPRGELF